MPKPTLEGILKDLAKQRKAAEQESTRVRKMALAEAKRVGARDFNQMIGGGRGTTVTQMPSLDDLFLAAAQEFVFQQRAIDSTYRAQHANDPFWKKTEATRRGLPRGW